MLTVDIVFLNECFDYDPSTGVVCWRERPSHHFAKRDRWVAWNKAHAGQEVCSKDKEGYFIVCISNRQFRLHRVVWALMTGAWSDYQIDHENRIKGDNRWTNLRQAPGSGNQQNISHGKGWVFISHPNLKKPYRAQIVIDRRTVFLGHFATAEEANAAYRDAKRQYHPFASEYS